MGWQQTLKVNKVYPPNISQSSNPFKQSSSTKKFASFCLLESWIELYDIQSLDKSIISTSSIPRQLTQIDKNYILSNNCYSFDLIDIQKEQSIMKLSLKQNYSISQTAILQDNLIAFLNSEGKIFTLNLNLIPLNNQIKQDNPENQANIQLKMNEINQIQTNKLETYTNQTKLIPFAYTSYNQSLLFPIYQQNQPFLEFISLQKFFNSSIPLNKTLFGQKNQVHKVLSSQFQKNMIFISSQLGLFLIDLRIKRLVIGKNFVQNQEQQQNQQNCLNHFQPTLKSSFQHYYSLKNKIFQIDFRFLNRENIIIYQNKGRQSFSGQNDISSFRFITINKLNDNLIIIKKNQSSFSVNQNCT